MKSDIKTYIAAHTEELYTMLRELCLIPAPSHHEEKRAEYCLGWFHKNGMKDAYIDGALNVIFPYEAEGSRTLSVMAAHTDTVFPDTEPMPYLDDGERIFCPGVGDDTASVVALMLTAKYFHENKIPTKGMLFVCNSCEEGLGNLKGTRLLFESFGERIKDFITLDTASFHHGYDRCVGSHRYEVRTVAEGGHSWERFGNTNAIASLSAIVSAIYAIRVPEKEGKKVTYNVGTISGGTSVNTIAGEATMLCEYRSDDLELLSYMKSEFERIFEEARSDRVKVEVTLLGERPCAATVTPESMARLKGIAARAVTEVTGEGTIAYGAGSTDCNIPLSLGIPAIDIGVYRGRGCHTREESLLKSSLIPGLEIAIRVALGLAEG